MPGRFRIVLVAVAVAVGITLVGVSPVDAKKPSFCGYVRKHTFEFTQVFGSDTNPVIAAASSEQEVRRLLKRAPSSLKQDFKTFLQLLAAIRTQDSAAISAVAPAAGAASKRILDYVRTKCGVTPTTPPT